MIDMLCLHGDQDYIVLQHARELLQYNTLPDAKYLYTGWEIMKLTPDSHMSDEMHQMYIDKSFDYETLFVTTQGFIQMMHQCPPEMALVLDGWYSKVLVPALELGHGWLHLPDPKDV